MPLTNSELAALQEIAAKPLAEQIPLLVDGLASPTRKTEFKDEAVRRLQKIGAPAVARLTEALETTIQQPETEEETDKKNCEEFRQMFAARALAGMGQNAAGAAAKLNELFVHSSKAYVKKEAALALGKIGPVPDESANAETVFELVNALNAAKDNWHEDVRAAVAQTLGELRAQARNAVPALINCLMDRSDLVRAAASAALVKIGTEAMPALVATLKNRALMRSAAWLSEKLEVADWMSHFDHETIRDEFFFNRVKAARNDFWFIRQLKEQQEFVEMIFEGAASVLGQLGNIPDQAQAVLQEIVQADANAKLKTIAAEALARLAVTRKGSADVIFTNP